MWKLTKSCRHARTAKVVCQQSLASIIKQKQKKKLLTKRPPVAITVPSGTNTVIWGIGIPGYTSVIWGIGIPGYTSVIWGIGIPGYTFGSSIQAGAFPPPSWCFPGDYRQSIESLMGVPTFNSTEKALEFTNYDYILRLRQKDVIFDKILNLSSNTIKKSYNSLDKFEVFRSR